MVSAGSAKDNAVYSRAPDAGIRNMYSEVNTQHKTRTSFSDCFGPENKESMTDKNHVATIETIRASVTVCECVDATVRVHRRAHIVISAEMHRATNVWNNLNVVESIASKSSASVVARGYWGGRGGQGGSVLERCEANRGSRGFSCCLSSILIVGCGPCREEVVLTRNMPLRGYCWEVIETSRMACW
jgi:hypothetical protein